MLLTKEEIKSWLRTIGKDREWLGQKTFVSKRQVDNWLSSGRNIPLAKMRIIEDLMNPNNHSGEQPSDVAGVNAIAVVFTNAEYRAIKETAESLGMTIEEFIRDSSINK